MARKGADFMVSVFPNASYLMIAATRPSDDELPRLTAMVPGYYDLVTASNAFLTTAGASRNSSLTRVAPIYQALLLKYNY